MKKITQLLTCSALLSISGLSLAADEISMPMQGQMPMQRMQEHIKQMDTNGDGNITKQEYLANCEKRFAKMDSNGDGQITPQERQQMRPQMMPQKGQQPGATTQP